MNVGHKHDVYALLQIARSVQTHKWGPKLIFRCTLLIGTVCDSVIGGINPCSDQHAHPAQALVRSLQTMVFKPRRYVTPAIGSGKR